MSTYIYFIAGTVIADIGAKREVRTIIERGSRILTESDLSDVKYEQGKTFTASAY